MDAKRINHKTSLRLTRSLEGDKQVLVVPSEPSPIFHSPKIPQLVADQPKLVRETFPVFESELGAPIIVKDIKKLTGYLHNPLVCLTFDDGPDPVYTPMILDVLAKHQAHATFFVIGSAAKRYPQLIKRMLEEGHAVGNHTYSHHHPWFISSRRARLEVSQTSHVLRQITGQSPRWFRPPHGRHNKAMLTQATLEKMTTVMWSLSAIDWGPLATQERIARRLHDIKFGDIVLMHDAQRDHNHPELTAKNLPHLIKSLQERDILPVTLDQIG